MKKLVIIAALLLIQTQVLSAPANTTNTNYNKQPAQRQQVNYQQQTNNQVNRPAQQKSYDNTYSADYLLKYNIDDLEAAPWLNGGKRKI